MHTLCWRVQDEDEDYLGDGGRREGGQEGSPQPRKPEQAPGGNAQKKGTKRPAHEAPEPAQAAAAEAQPKRSRLTKENDGRAAPWQQAAAPNLPAQVRLFRSCPISLLASICA